LALLLKLQQQHQIAYLFISHDLNVIQTIAHKIAVMQNGKIIETGPASTILTNPQTPYTQTLLTAAGLAG
jgi:ABC-type microcin C transport system duplicated ATPase subunit YejF